MVVHLPMLVSETYDIIPLSSEYLFRHVGQLVCTKQNSNMASALGLTVEEGGFNL
jgi:hypothetical protein